VTKTIRVNVTSVANAKAVRKEKRNGRDVIIVPSATLPDNIVMNGSLGPILYPADEIAKSFKGLERTPAPLGHPTINGKFVSASDPEGINIGHIGAWNENVRQEKGRVLLDKVIDVEVANRSEGGKAVLAAIEAGGPIHTSTGLLCTLEAVNGTGSKHKHIARSMVFDHDAILLNEEGAATPEKGVGMLVNSSGEEEEIEVINSTIVEDADREIDWAGTRLVEALRRRESIGTWDRIKSALMEAIGLSERATPTTNTKDDDMDQVQFDALSLKVDALSEAMKPDALATAIGNAVAAAMKPVLDAQAQTVANQQAADDAEHADLVGKVVKANLLDEVTAKATPLNTLRALAPKTVAGKAAPLNAAMGTGGDKPGFKLPKGE
tara:strand:- start:25944 stop:27083 length:1140 start_codon:yes stop_codon:yes gene_type:complete